MAWVRLRDVPGRDAGSAKCPCRSRPGQGRLVPDRGGLGECGPRQIDGCFCEPKGS